MFILLFWLFMWFKKHLWEYKYEISLCSSPMWIEKNHLHTHKSESFWLCHLCELKKKLVMRPQVCISFIFFYCNSKKNHLWAHKCAISFIFFSYVSWKDHLQACKCVIPFISSPMWVKKATWGLVNVQYHFFHLHEFLKITCKPANV